MKKERKRKKSEKYLCFIPPILNISKLEKYWDNSLNTISKNEDWKYSMQSNLFWDDKEKQIYNIYKFKSIFQYKSLFAYDNFYFSHTYKQYKLFYEKILNVTIVSPVCWLFINSFYLKFLDEFDDKDLESEIIQTFYPYMVATEKHLYSWKQFNDYLKIFINKKFLKIDIKNFYSNINIDYFVYFCYQNYEYVKNNYMDFMWIFNLISYYSDNDSFPFLENCPFLSFCSSKLFLRKKLINFISKFKYKNFIEKIVHYVDDIFIIFNNNWNNNKINDFYNSLIDVFNENKIYVNYSKTKYGILTTDEIDKNICSMEIMEINSTSNENKKATYSELNDYLNSFNNYLQTNNDKLISFFNVENSINCPKKLKFFVFLNETNISGDINSLTFFNDINSQDLIKMINCMPKYFIYIFGKFASNYDINNKNPFKLIVKEWENLSTEIQIHYSMLRTFKKIEKNTNKELLSKNNLNNLLKLKDFSWINDTRKEDNDKVQNMFFQSYYLYKKSNKYKYLIMFISSCSIVLEMLNKIKKNICKKKKCSEKYVFMCDDFTIIDKDDKNICKEIIAYRDNNSLVHANFDSKETTTNIEINKERAFCIIKKILFFILGKQKNDI